MSPITIIDNFFTQSYLDYFLKITGLKEKILEKKIIDSRKFSNFASKIKTK